MTPLAKAIRTFAASMVGVLGAVVLAVQASDYHAGGVVLTVGLVVAVIAGLISFLQNSAEVLVADTPAKKALATFLQFVAAGLGTVAVATLTDIVELPKVLVPMLAAAVVAALQTFAQTSAEGVPA